MRTDGVPNEWQTFIGDDGIEYTLDVTFLASGWECVFGRGCKGIYDDSVNTTGCCSIGVWFYGKDDLKKTINAAKALSPEQWASHPDNVNKKVRSSSDWLEYVTTTDDDGDPKTATMELHDGSTVCVFFNPIGHEFYGCALHHAGAANGGGAKGALDNKPFVCGEVPFRQDWDESGVAVTIYGITNRDWAKDHSEEVLDWWCVDDGATYVSQTPVYVRERDTLLRMIPEDVYAKLSNFMYKRQQALGTQPHRGVRVEITSRPSGDGKRTK